MVVRWALQWEPLPAGYLVDVCAKVALASDPGSWRRCWMAPGRLDPVESGQARLPGFRTVKRTLTSTSHGCLSAVSGCGRGSTTHRRSRQGARVGTWAVHHPFTHSLTSFPEHVYTHLGWRVSNAAGKHTAVAVFKRARAAPRDDASTQTRWRRCDDGFERQAGCRGTGCRGRHWGSFIHSHEVVDIAWS